ncbi:glycine betaine ABC transporter substrate-binding protein [Xylanivirga thermophila]|uniref:glycine betaine ABC transporter substrate-binding protein n=1 Tax=Xylanivirga thermophila TaxID=2496273 RepID=UPI001FB4FF80|nr:glycine betaine ABC transporter substrate-binding protein [Xylanivirga thermophila]
MKIVLSLILVGIILFSVNAYAYDNKNNSNEGQKKEKLIFADAGWDSIKIHNAIAATIIENGYGYKTDIMTGSSPIVIRGIRQGDIDICMESWTDNIKDVYEPGIENGEIIELSVNFDDNAQGLYVPTYVIEGDKERGIEPLAPDLKSIKDLPRYWDVFNDPDMPNKGRIYGAPPNWASDEILRTKMDTYKLDETYDYFNPGSDTSLNTSIVSAYEKGEPWVGYYWDPTWITGKYDMTLLEDEPYTEEKWANGYRCEFPGVRVTIAVNKNLPEKTPEVAEFLKNYKTSTKLTSEMLAYMQDNDAEPEEVAKWFLQEHKDIWTKWVPDDIAQKVNASIVSGNKWLDMGIREFPQAFSIRFGFYVEKFVDWLTRHCQGFFDGLGTGVNWIVSHIQKFLTFIPWFIFILLIFILGWRMIDLKSGFIYAIMTFLIGTLGLWNEMMFTLSIVLTGVIISIIIGIPIGIHMAYNSKVEAFMKPLLDGAQTMPSFVHLIPAMIFFGLGTVPAVFATIIYSTAPCIRLTNLAIRRVPKEMREAAYSYGSSSWQVLTKVELPQAMPTIMTGINQTTMAAMSMVVISSMIGAKGLGEKVLIAINRTDIAMGFDAGISIVFLAIIIDRITQTISKKYKHV